MTNSTRNKDHWILLDTAAEVSVVADSMPGVHGKEAATVDTYITDYSGNETRASRTGVLEMLPKLGNVLVQTHNQDSSNIISFGQLRDADHMIEYKHDVDEFHVVTDNGDTMIFKRSAERNMYAARVPARAEVHVTTVSELEAHIPKKQLEQLRKTQTFLKNTAGLCEQDALRMVRNGDVDNLHGIVTLDSVKLAYQLRDANAVANLRGKGTRKPGKAPKNSDSLLVRPAEAQIFQSDTMWVGGLGFLVSQSYPLELTLSTQLAGPESTDNLIRAINAQKSQVGQYHHKVHQMRMEPIKAAIAMVGQLGQTKLDLGGAGDHCVPKADAAIKHLKNIIRTVNSTLSWKCPRSWIPDLVTYAKIRKNQRSPSTLSHSVPPITLLTGVRLTAANYKFGFGDYVEASTPNYDSNNALVDRTVPAIVLFQNTNGTWECRSLLTDEYLHRDADQLTLFPTPQKYIDLINALAEKQQKKCKKNDPSIEESVAPDADQPPEAPTQHLDLIPLRDKRKLSEEQVSTTASGADTAQQGQGVAEEPQLDKCLDNEDIHHDAPSEPTVAAQNGGADTAPPATEIAQVSAPPTPVISPTADIKTHNYGTRQATKERGKASLMMVNVYTLQARQAARDAQERELCAWQSRHLTTRKGRRNGVKKSAAVHNMTARKAMKANEKDATTALLKELNSLIHTKEALTPVMMDLLSAKQKKKILRSILFFKEKHLADGTYDKLKARLCANGAQQDRSLYPDRGSPTAELSSILMILALAAQKGLEVAIIDFTCAYLHADLPPGDEVYIKADSFVSAWIAKYMPELEPFLSDLGELTFKVNKALYGLVESARLWYNTLTAALLELGFTQNVVDECVFNRTNSDGSVTTVAIYVDDLLSVADKTGHLQRLVDELKERFQEVTYHINTDLSYLGMAIKLCPDGTRITMDHMVQEILNDYPATTTNEASPAADNLFDPGDSPALDDKAAKTFHTMVARLLYLTQRVRPDLAVAVAYLTTRVTCPTELDQFKVQKVVNRLHATKDQGLFFPRSGDPRLSCYADAAFGCHADGKSHTGIVFMLGDAVVLIKSMKQKMVGKDSTEAELIALTDMLSYATHCHDFLVAQGVQPLCPLVLQDNKSVITQVSTSTKKMRTLHLKVRRAIAKEMWADGEIEIQYCHTKEMSADLLTKPLHGKELRHLTNKITHDVK